MRIGRFLAGAGALTAIGVLVAPGLAEAHTAVATPSCSRLSVDVSLYDAGVKTTITVDGNATTHTGNGSWQIPWADTESHTWQVIVDDVDDQYDHDFHGTQQPCVTTTTAAPTTTAPTTTTAPATTAPDDPTTTTTTVASSTTQPGATTTTTARATSTTATGGSSRSGGSSSSGSSSSGSGSLPATGYASGVIAALAAAFVVTGTTLWLIARRRAVS